MPVSRSATCTISLIGVNCGIRPIELLAIFRIERTTVPVKPAISLPSHSRQRHPRGRRFAQLLIEAYHYALGRHDLRSPIDVQKCA